MSASIEIWRSKGGTIWPDDFSLMTTVADGAPWFSLDSPTVPGQLYIYRARRLDNATGIYSGWSPYAFVVGPYPAGANPMYNYNVGANPGFVTKAGIAIEPSTPAPGQPCKSSRLLSLISLDPGKSGMKRIEREDWRGLPGVTGVINGEAEYSLKLTVAATPESFDELLSAYFGAPTTAAVAVPATPSTPVITNGGTPGVATYAYKIVARTGSTAPASYYDSAKSAAGSTTTGNATLSPTNFNTITWTAVPGATQYLVLNSTTSHIVAVTQGLTANDTGVDMGAYVAPSSPTGNQQLWNTNIGGLYASIPVYFGQDAAGNNMLRLYSGCRGDKLSMKFDKKSSTPFRLECDLKALYEIDWYNVALSTIGFDTATYDTLDPYSEAVAVVSIGGILADCTSFTASIDRSLQSKDVLTGYAGPNCFYQGGAKHKLTATLVFSNDAEKQRYFGQVNATGQYSQINKVLYFPIQLLVANPVNGGGIINQFGIYSAYAAYDTVGEAIKDKNGLIMQDIEIIPVIDPGSTATDIQITNINSRSNASIITAGTLITGVTGGGINPYSN